MSYSNYKTDDKLYGFNDNMVELKPNDTFNSLFNSKEASDTSKLFHNPLFKQLNKEYKKVFEAGNESGLTDGEIQMLIHLYSDGKPLHEIEHRRIEELTYWIRCNVDKVLPFVNPELHAFLLRTQYYKKDKKETAKPHRMVRISKIIKSLFGQNQSREKLKKFSEILSRL